MSEKYKLLEDGRVEYTFQTETMDFKNEEKELIGEYYNTSVTYLKDKETAISHLEKQQTTTEESLKGVRAELEGIKINDSLAIELKEITKLTADMLEEIKKINDFSNEKYVSNNPQKFGKMLREARMLKENVLGEIQEIDKVTRLHTRKEDLTSQKKLYSEQLEKMTRQLKEVKEL